ncbi:MAG: hypothetical protein DRJ47_10495 [Thermoprotei archaeon]|nr:MAG: hypothetical protein DRJ47_10495 [Thermoprotei archaeon]
MIIRNKTLRKVGSVCYELFVIAFLIVFLLPVWWTISTAIKTIPEAYRMPPQWIPSKPTFYYFIKVFLSRPVFHWIWNSALLAGGVTILCIFIGLLCAYSLTRFRFRGSDKMSFMLIATRFIPPMSLTVPIFMMMKSLGIYDSLLSVIIVLTYLNLPFTVWLLKAFLSTAPWALEEMGMIDGCSRMGAFIRIVLPVISPGILATTIITWLGCWNEFYWPLVLTKSREAQVIGLGIYDFMGDAMTYINELCGGGLIMCIPSFIFCFIASKYIVAGLTKGALKGL